MGVPIKLRHLSAVVAIGFAIARSAAAVVYDGVDFPQGDVSFADTVISFQPDFSGGNVPTDPKYVNPQRALGPPDFVPDAGGMGGEFNGTGAVALGDGGRLRVAFQDNVVTNSGSSAADLAIFERGVDESFFVAVRPANATTRALLAARCPTNGYCALANARLPVNHVVQIDLDAELGGSFAPGVLRFDAVQLTDTTTQGATSGEQVGPDIDAVGAISSSLVVCGDGRVEVTETCDDGGLVDGDGCSAGCRIESCWLCTPGVEPSVCTTNGGAPCDDGDPCTAGDVCGGPQGLTCIGGPPPDCDDANPCTDDSCLSGVGCAWVPNTELCDDGSSCSADDRCIDGACVGTAVEVSGCRIALGTTQLRLVNRLDNTLDALVWVWPFGEATPVDAFGDPLFGTGSYEICVFDGPPQARRLRASARAQKGQSCGAASCWKVRGKNADRYLFKNIDAPDGLRQLMLKSGTDARAKVVAKGRGRILGLSGADIMELPVRVQLRDTSTNECFEDVYPDAIRNDDQRFKAKH